MPVALLRVELRLYGTRTLKEKRAVLEGLLVRLRREFNVSAAELDFLDDPGRAVLGFAHLSNNGAYSDGVLQKILERLEGSREFFVEAHEVEVYWMRERARARLAEAIAREIAEILEFEAKDPVLRKALPTVLRAELSPDGQEARILIYVSGTEEERARVMAAFAKDTGFLRSALAKRLSVRRVPRLSFALDTSPDRWAEPPL